MLAMRQVFALLAFKVQMKESFIAPRSNFCGSNNREISPAKFFHQTQVWRQIEGLNLPFASLRGAVIWNAPNFCDSVDRCRGPKLLEYRFQHQRVIGDLRLVEDRGPASRFNVNETKS